MHSQFGEDRGHVAFDRAFGEEQRLGDLGVRVALQTRFRTWRSRWERFGRSTPARTLRGTTDWPLSTARTLATSAMWISGSKTIASAPASSVRRTAVAVERGETTTIGGAGWSRRNRRSAVMSVGRSTSQAKIKTVWAPISYSERASRWATASTVMPAPSMARRSSLRRLGASATTIG